MYCNRFARRWYQKAMRRTIFLFACVMSIIGCAQSHPLHLASIPETDLKSLGDGKTDCTEIFQSALNAMAQAGGGTVSAPRGNFLFKGHLNVPNGVTLAGIWTSVPAHNGI